MASVVEWPASAGGFASDTAREVTDDNDGASSLAGSHRLRKLETNLTSPEAGADPASRGASFTPSSGATEESASVQGDDEERMQRMASACRTLLECLGEDPTREGLLKTPMRMAKALVACTVGYSQEPAVIVSDALFACDGEDMVVVRDIVCYSMCEHHMLPFMGKVHIGYLPQGKVVGLSKLARLTDCFSKRLQIQERLTRQIADAVQECTGAAGVAVMVEATHMCMAMRGVEKPGAMTQSVSYTGSFRDSKDLRQEFTAAVRAGSGGH